MDHLDGWRGGAIACVLVAHFTPGVSIGRFGVDLFFVLSGLLMSRVLFEDRVPLGIFYRRRVSRIMPAFVAFAAIVLLVWPWQGFGEFVGIVTFTRPYLEPRIWDSVYPVGHLWSLAVEEHAYVLLATLALFPLVRETRALVLLSLGLATFAAFGLYAALSDDQMHRAWTHRTEVAATCLMLSAGYRQLMHRYDWKVPPWLPLLAVAIAAACYLNRSPYMAKFAVAPFLLAFSINHIHQTYDWALGIMRWKPMVLLGLWSYSLYLWQQPFYRMAKAGHIAVPIALAATFACALASYYLLEMPARRWLNENWRPQRKLARQPM